MLIFLLDFVINSAQPWVYDCRGPPIAWEPQKFYLLHVCSLHCEQREDFIPQGYLSSIFHKHIPSLKEERIYLFIQLNFV